MHFDRAHRCDGDGKRFDVIRGAAKSDPDRLTYSATARRLNRHCSCWLQQTPAHSRNRIRERRYLSLFRRATCSVSRADVGGVKSAVLRFQYQTTLSVHSDPIAAKGNRLRTVRDHANRREKNFDERKFLRLNSHHSQTGLFC